MAILRSLYAIAQFPERPERAETPNLPPFTPEPLFSLQAVGLVLKDSSF